jgi:hypothetical protein
MHADRFRLFAVAAVLLASAPAVAQTANVTVYARMSGAGAVGRVDLAPALDVAPSGPGPEDLPASAPTSPELSCRTDGATGCVGAAALGSTVILRPADVSNATFVSWSGCTAVTGTGLASRCSVAVTSAKAVTASFKATAFALTAKTYPVPTSTFTPPSGGRVEAPSTPPIACRTGSTAYTACAGLVANGASIVVTAIPDAGSKVTGWSGCTSSTATTCTVSPMNAAKTVSATFGAANVPVSAAVSGSGTITAPLGGAVVDALSCPADCTGAVTPGGSLTLTATPASGQAFVAWSGCASTTSVCTLSNVTTPVSVTATFRSSCDACHGMPPAAPHVARSDCDTCHPGYTATSVDPALHMNGTVDPKHADALGDACAADPDVVARCKTCHPCYAR